jgi:ubiquinone/menaquinone biosynthesis C-methylase UbiE
VRDGLYPASLAHDFPWRTFASVYPRIVADAPRMRRRAHENRFDDVPPEAGDYPRYYRRTFHFQTEGYLSEHSAALYDTQVELLFGGTAQVMRRQALPPLVEALRGRERARTRVLDLACGTGNVLRMLAAALPGLSLFGVDLSPHYIAHARRRLDDVVPLSLVVENAESLPFVDGYFDAVVNVFLMHELPPKVRSRVLSEVARVLAPGGRFVLADSVQRVDAPAIARLLENFPKQFHEPFYRQYLGDDLLGRFAQAGLVVDDVRQAFLTKIVVAHRPAAS